jgi:hypothetical protein
MAHSLTPTLSFCPPLRFDPASPTAVKSPSGQLDDYRIIIIKIIINQVLTLITIIRQVINNKLIIAVIIVAI